MIDDAKGCRFLVVEDETLVAVVIEDVLLELGCVVVGTAAKLETALQLADKAEFDAAILDVNILGGNVYPLAEQLVRRRIPFVLASGYGDWTLPESLRDHPRLMKPFTMAALEGQIRSLCDEVAGRKKEPAH
jgi:two-component SAPR family response regulator